VSLSKFEFCNTQENKKKDALDTLPIPKYAPWFRPQTPFLVRIKKPFFISSHADITTIAMIRRRPPLKVFHAYPATHD